MKLKKGRRQCQDVLVVLVLLQHSPTLCQGELAFRGDVGDGWCVFLHCYNCVQVKATPPPGTLALPGVCFYVADLLLSLSPLCADEATCMSGTGQLLQGWWLSTPSLSAPLSALGFRNPTEQVVKQQCAGNRGQRHGLGAWVPSAVALGSVTCWWLFAAHHWGQAVWEWLLPTQLPHPHHAITCPCSQPDVLLQAGKHGSVTCPGLQGAGWTPQLLATWTDGMAGAQWDCELGLSEGILERQFTNSCYPMETPAWGISKIPSLSKAEASPSWFLKAIQDSSTFPNPSKGWAEGHWWPEQAPQARWPAGVFKGGSSHTQWGEEAGLISGMSLPCPQLLCATNNKCFRETAQNEPLSWGQALVSVWVTQLQRQGPAPHLLAAPRALNSCCAAAQHQHLTWGSILQLLRPGLSRGPVLWLGKLFCPRPSKVAVFIQVASFHLSVWAGICCLRIRWASASEVGSRSLIPG